MGWNAIAASLSHGGCQHNEIQSLIDRSNCHVKRRFCKLINGYCATSDIAPMTGLAPARGLPAGTIVTVALSPSAFCDCSDLSRLVTSKLRNRGSDRPASAPPRDALKKFSAPT